MKIDNAVALVTGANRGIGLAFTRELLARGARKACAGARDPSTVTQPGVEAIRLDVTKPEEVLRPQHASSRTPVSATRAAFSLLTAKRSHALSSRPISLACSVMSKAFAPALNANGGGALLNVLSISSWR